MLKADSARNRLVGIALVSLCYALFTLLDGTAKWLVASVPVIVVVWLRFLMHAVFASALLLPLRGRSLIKTDHLRWHAQAQQKAAAALPSSAHSASWT